MQSSELLAEAFGRVRGIVHDAVAELTTEQLNFRVEEGANSVAWLVWHLSRVQDSHIAEVADTEEVWRSGHWVHRFRLPLDESSTGFGQGLAEMAAVRVESPDLLTGYYDQVHEQTLGYLRTLADTELDKVIDQRWDPPVTLGVRLASVLADDLQHAGQAAYLRGIVDRMTP